jgi:hypothetical protein
MRKTNPAVVQLRQQRAELKAAQADAAKPGQRRRYCHWIANKWDDRCPRSIETKEQCWCRCADDRVEPDWPWRVVPKLADPGGPAWSYDNEFGPLLIDDEASRAWLKKEES